MSLSFNKIITLISIILVTIILIVFETIFYLKSQYHHGLDKEICKCKGLNSSTKARIINGKAVNNNDLQWIAVLFLKNLTNDGIFNKIIIF